MPCRKNFVVLVGLLLSGLLLTQLDSLRAQKSASPKKNVVTTTSPPEKSKGPEPVVIERDPLRLIDPEGFQIPLQLEPIRALTLTSSRLEFARFFAAQGRHQPVAAALRYAIW